ncbi:unannotated protein [freshwater metagenome]|uniref:Unannotated protein n=1 Tax=freshwater metagenome TaxID=449393 RepID=A0A6J6G2K6_9ZZZZ
MFAAALGAGLPLETARRMSKVENSLNAEIVDAVIGFSRSTGAPRKGVLTALADALDDSEQRERQITVGMVSAIATTRVLCALPGVTAVAAEMFGFPVIVFLLTTLSGFACLVTGTALVLGSWRWMLRIRRSIPHPPVETGLVLDLAAALCRSSTIRAEQVHALTQLAERWGTVDEIPQLDDSIRMSRTHGVPVSHLLSIAAARSRADAKHRVSYAIELLPTKLLAPVGTLLLPAFVITTVIPVVASLAQQFLLS